MFKTILYIAIVVTVLSVIGLVIPDALTTGIDAALIYFMTSIYYLNHLFNVQTFMTCFQILLNFEIGVATFFVFHWVLRLIK